MYTYWYYTTSGTSYQGSPMTLCKTSHDIDQERKNLGRSPKIFSFRINLRTSNCHMFEHTFEA